MITYNECLEERKGNQQLVHFKGEGTEHVFSKYLVDLLTDSLSKS